eukprot:6173367-Pyramimonas_sp.AAC.1
MCIRDSNHTSCNHHPVPRPSVCPWSRASPRLRGDCAPPGQAQGGPQKRGEASPPPAHCLQTARALR